MYNNLTEIIKWVQMIASLKGILTSIGKSEIIIEVNGVGYLLNVTSKLISTFHFYVSLYHWGIVNMLEDNKSEDLSRLFNLYSDVDKGLIPVAKAMQQYICKLGDEYITESKEEKSKY